MNALAMAFAPAVSIDLYHIIGYRMAIVISALASLCMILTIQFVSNKAQPTAKQAAAAAKGKLKIIQKQ